MLEGMTPQIKKPRCKVRSILEVIEAKDKEILLLALANEDWTTSALARELTARGLPTSEKPIAVHRRKECSCAR